MKTYPLLLVWFWIALLQALAADDFAAVQVRGFSLSPDILRRLEPLLHEKKIIDIRKIESLDRTRSVIPEKEVGYVVLSIDLALEGASSFEGIWYGNVLLARRKSDIHWERAVEISLPRGVTFEHLTTYSSDELEAFVEKEKKPNKALVPTATSVTPAADAPVAPAAAAAHL